MSEPSRDMLRRAAPFATAAALAFATVPLPPEADGRQLLGAAALFVIIAIVGIGVPALRPPRPLSVVAPLAYLVVLALMRDAQGGPQSGYAPLAILPVLWIALYGRRWQLVPCIVGVASLFIVPLLGLGSAEYPASEWRRAILWTTVSAIVGFTAQTIVAGRAREALERATERDFIDAIVASAGALVVVCDRSGRVVRFNGAAEQAAGVPASEATGRGLWDLDILSEYDADAAREMFEDIDTTPFPLAPENAWTGRDGPRRAIIWSCAAVRDGAGGVTHVVATGIDVTRQRAAEATARMAERQFIAAFDHAPIGMALIDLTGRLVSVNPALSALTGYPQSELETMNADHITHPDDLSAATRARAVLLTGRTDNHRIEHRLVHRDGRSVDVAVQVSLMRDVTGMATTYVVQMLDITERKRSEQQLQHMADHDSLTGLLNRRRFEQELKRHVAVAARYGSGGAAIVLDIDGFKQVNDTHGHHVGDEVILAVARTLRSSLRETDVLARLGGDEFAVLLPRSDREGAEVVAAKLIAAARSAHGSTGSGVTVSIGIRLIGWSRGLTAENALIDADRAMYAAKAAGRDRYAFHGAGDQLASPLA